jgi:two-component system, OmpR family, phosphate regulon sensor histidine kinase PhoR
MKKDTVHYNEQVNKVMLRMARFIPIVMLGYGIAVHFKLVSGSDFYSLTALLSLITVFIIAGITQDDGYEQSMLQQSIYYLLFLSYSLFVVGMYSVIIYWAPLSMSTVLNYGMRAYWMSTVLLAIFAFIDAALHYPTDGYDYFIRNFILVLLTTVASYIAVALTKALMLDYQRLDGAKKKEAAQYDQMQALINSLNDAIFSISSHGKVRLYNAASLNLLDTNRSLSGKSIDEIFSITDTDGSNRSLHDVITKEKKLHFRDDLYHTFPGGEVIRLGITAAPIRTAYTQGRSRSEGYIFIVKDITKAKSLEDEKDEFISVVSHELRTPITIVEASLSNLRILAERNHFEETALSAIGESHDQILYLASMINDLSTLSRAEQSSIVSNEVLDVTAFTQDIYRRYTTAASDAGLLLEMDINPHIDTITTNRLYLSEILQNLITNAIKYTKDGYVKLSVHKTAQGTTFSVHDTGVGISKADRAKVFDKFYRAEDYRTRETSGTGLGLYVAQKLARKLQSRIELSSRLNHGSTFSITIK